MADVIRRPSESETDIPEREVFRPAVGYPMDEAEIEAFFAVKRAEVPRFRHLFNRGAFDLLRLYLAWGRAGPLTALRGAPAEVASQAESCHSKWMSEQ